MTIGTEVPERPRLALVGPVLPFRGGIAQHTTMLHRAASGLTELLTISFIRQYPAWLFPGQSDRDPAYRGHLEPGAEYLIDSLNPISWRRAADRIIEYRPDTVVLPWWNVYWALCFWYLARRFRLAGLKVTFLCHNVVEHESAAWKGFLTRQVLKQGHDFLVQSSKDGQALREFLPRAKVRCHPHPIYDQFPQPSGKLPRRAGLELLFFGLVRPYKGLDILIDALALMPRSADFFLTIAGEFWQNKAEFVQRIAEKSLQDRIDLIDRYLPEQEVAELFQRTDLVVLPYRSATGSGVIPLAYHYRKPVIATRVGGLPEVVEDGETGLLVPPENPEELAAAITSITRQTLDLMTGRIDAYKQRFSWQALVQAIVKVS